MATRPLVRIDAGWLFVIGGLAMLVAVVVLPGRRAVHDMREQLRVLQDQESFALARLNAYEEFLRALREGDEQVIRRLAASHLNLVPEGETAVMLASSLDDTVPDWIDETLDVAPSLATPYPDTLLIRLAEGRNRLWILCGSVLVIFFGLIMGPEFETRRRPAGRGALFDPDGAEGVDSIGPGLALASAGAAGTALVEREFDEAGGRSEDALSWSPGEASSQDTFDEVAELEGEVEVEDEVGLDDESELETHAELDDDAELDEESELEDDAELDDHVRHQDETVSDAGAETEDHTSELGARDALDDAPLLEDDTDHQATVELAGTSDASNDSGIEVAGGPVEVVCNTESSAIGSSDAPTADIEPHELVDLAVGVEVRPPAIDGFAAVTPTMAELPAFDQATGIADEPTGAPPEVDLIASTEMSGAAGHPSFATIGDGDAFMDATPALESAAAPETIPMASSHAEAPGFLAEPAPEELAPSANGIEEEAFEAIAGSDTQPANETALDIDDVAVEETDEAIYLDDSEIDEYISESEDADADEDEEFDEHMDADDDTDDSPHDGPDDGRDDVVSVIEAMGEPMDFEVLEDPEEDAEDDERKDAEAH